MVAKINNRLIIHLTIVITVLSQLESLRQSFRPLMYVMWFFLIGLGLIRNNKGVRITRTTKIFAIFYLLFFVFCLLATLITKRDYLSGSYLGTMIIPLAVSICMGIYSSDLSYEDILSLCKTFVIIALIYGIYVNAQYFPSYSSWLIQRRYIFASKNSAAQIWSVALFLSFFMPKLTKVKRSCLWYIICVYFVFICALSQGRTALLGITICSVIYVIVSSKHKIRWSIITCVIVVAALTQPEIRQFLDQALLITRYSGQGVNAFSSGRVNGYLKAIESILTYPFAGVGSYYIDCSYLMILAETGIIGFAIIETIWISRVVTNFRWKVKNNKSNWKKLVFLITIFYIVESILEGLPPFGPGVSSFMFWILCGATVDNIDFNVLRYNALD
ncbi:MAG: O-antigen ligase family protein [Christensenellaceae bacterium]|nr:O-antigen ligase family protein [Christensenellaceae bacterium]